VTDDLGPDLNQFLAQAGQRPWLRRLGHRQRSHKVAEVVGQHMQLETHRIGGERSTRQPRPFDRALAFLDPLLRRAALVVAGDDPLGRPRQVGDDIADPWVQFPVMPFDLGRDAARLARASHNGGVGIGRGILDASKSSSTPPSTNSVIART
jgi:hypothetical protein